MSNEKTQIFDKKQKWSFGMGSFAQWFINGAFNTWVFSFYFTAVKLDIRFIMLAYVLWTLWNAFNDPLIGYLSDRTSTKWGRREPYIMLGSVPIIIIEVIIWLPPIGNDILIFVYLLIMLICYDTFYSMVALPFDALFPELYNTEEERAEVNTIKQILATIGLILAFLVPGIFIGELDDKTGYLINGVVTSILVGISLLIALKWGVIEREEFKLDHKHEFGFLKGMKYLLKNKGFILYTILFFLYEYILLVLSTTVPLYARHVLNVNDTFLTSLMLGAMFLIGIITVVIWNKLDIKLGSRKAYAISMIAYVIATIPLLIVDAFETAIIVVIFMGFGFGGMLYFVYLIIADVIDEDELKTGVRREGTFFGITNFFMRLAMVFSILTVGLVFTSVGWEEYTPTPGVNEILGLKILVTLFPAIAIGISLTCLYFYPYTKERVQEMKIQLAELHEKKLKKVQSM